MLKLIKTNSENHYFIELVKHLDTDLAVRDGEDYSFYAQFNKIASIKYVIVAFENEIPVGCGAIKEYDKETMEVKRMYTLPECRGKGIATKLLNELEKWTKELAYRKCVLETGYKQPEAIGLYKKNGYQQIPNYGQYKGVDNSVCFEKVVG
jgi:putative acetyltransferase